MAEVNDVVNESNVHLDFQAIQATSEPDLADYFKYLLKASNELYPLSTQEGAMKLYQYMIESAALA